jgi:murein DD-endopeptidase MepM/ murein hydrolase activator NlpD
MSQRVTSQHLRRPSAFRTRAAVLAAGLGASMVLGAGAAFAGEVTSTGAAGPSTAVAAQAVAQAKAAESAKKAAAGKAKKAQAKAQAQAQAKAKKAPAWGQPVIKYKLSATYGKAGDLWSSAHSGQDFAVPVGTKVSAVHGGTVVKAGPNGAGDGPAYGNAVVIKHDDNTYSQYAHLSRVDVHPGQKVKTGQKIALSGNTGNSSGPHLHFEIRTTANYGTAINPVSFLRSEGVKI